MGAGKVGSCGLPPNASVNVSHDKWVQQGRDWVELGYNLQHWTDMPYGGHFAAWEAPDLFVQDLASFGRRIGR